MTADPVSDHETSLPLVVDLDGTLCRTDTLHESLLRIAASAPLLLARLPRWLAQGRAEFKARLADRGVLEAKDLPLNDEVIALVRQARDEGRTTALVSASDHRQVTAIAEATDLFDAAYGSAEGRNLKGAEKAAFLTELYGARGFEYVGDSLADKPVWAAARRAVTVGATSAVRRAAEVANPHTVHIDAPKDRALSMLKAMRPHQWSKNLLIFLPVLAAHDLSGLSEGFIGFVAFCLTASAVYVLNDLVDLAADRAHPRKSKRPFASGRLSAATGLKMAAVLLFFAALLAFTFAGGLLIIVLTLYLILTFFYSFSLKRRLLVDVLALAALYTLRIIAGGVATGIDLSPWMLIFSIFIFLALAAVKRQAELTDQKMTGRDSSGRAYEVEDLPVIRSIAISAGHAAVLVLALYISSEDVQQLYRYSALLWLICPLLLYWILRMVMAAHRGEMTDDPIVFAATNHISLAILLACVAVGIAATVWPWTPVRI